MIFPKVQLGTCYSCKNSSYLSEALCHDCRSELPTLTTCCLRCGQATAQSIAVCGQCLKIPPSFDSVVAAYHYKKPVNRLIQSVKQGKNINIMKALLPELINKVGLSYSSNGFPEALVPVPMHWLRLWRRGFNQSYLLAKELQKALPNSIVIRELVKRSQVAPAQKTLSKSGRKKNVKNGFELRRKSHFKHIAIIDDVVTTGATCEAMAVVLKAHGVERVHVWSLARA